MLLKQKRKTFHSVVLKYIILCTSGMHKYCKGYWNKMNKSEDIKIQNGQINTQCVIHTYFVYRYRNKGKSVKIRNYIFGYFPSYTMLAVISVI